MILGGIILNAKIFIKHLELLLPKFQGIQNCNNCNEDCSECNYWPQVIEESEKWGKEHPWFNFNYSDVFNRFVEIKEYGTLLYVFDSYKISVKNAVEIIIGGKNENPTIIKNILSIKSEVNYYPDPVERSMGYSNDECDLISEHFININGKRYDYSSKSINKINSDFEDMGYYDALYLEELLNS